MSMLTGIEDKWKELPPAVKWGGLAVAAALGLWVLLHKKAAPAVNLAPSATSTGAPSSSGGGDSGGGSSGLNPPPLVGGGGGGSGPAPVSVGDPGQGFLVGGVSPVGNVEPPVGSLIVNGFGPPSPLNPVGPIYGAPGYEAFNSGPNFGDVLGPPGQNGAGLNAPVYWPGGGLVTTNTAGGINPPFSSSGVASYGAPAQNLTPGSTPVGQAVPIGAPVAWSPSGQPVAWWNGGH